MKNLDSKPTFVMFVGVPASGKSTRAEALRKEGYAIYSSDELRERTGEKNHAIVFATLHSWIFESLRKGENCVLDATNLNRKKRISLLDEVRKIGARTVCELFVVPPAVCKERNAGRSNDHGVTDEVIDLMLRRFECPWLSDGFDEIRANVYDGKVDLGFTDEDLDGFGQDNPHHSLTVGEHERLTAEIVARRVESARKLRLLTEVARRHDDGKFLTKTFVDRKGNPSEVAHFYGHDGVGAYLFLLRELSSENGNGMSVEEALYGAFLVSMHMRPITAWRKSPAAEERDRRRMGEEAYADLRLLHEADVSAKRRA